MGRSGCREVCTSDAGGGGSPLKCRELLEEEEEEGGLRWRAAQRESDVIGSHGGVCAGPGDPTRSALKAAGAQLSILRVHRERRAAGAKQPAAAGTLPSPDTGVRFCFCFVLFIFLTRKRRKNEPQEDFSEQDLKGKILRRCLGNTFGETRKQERGEKFEEESSSWCFCRRATCFASVLKRRIIMYSSFLLLF